MATEERAHYLRQAYEYAAVHSTDPSTQNGALLVMPPGIMVVKDANRFPDGVRESAERWGRPLKYSFVEHAERNVIYRAARLGVRTEGMTMYVPWVACADCGRAIIQAGINLLVGHDAVMHKGRADWYESIRLADEMFREAGVQVLRLPGRFDGVQIRFGGELVTPE